MPKIVDAEARREQVIEAVFRVIERDGLAQASLRNVAGEAGLVIGSIRHYFASHSELMTFAMSAMTDRISGRLLAHVANALGPDPDDPRKLVEAMLGELLPLNPQRQRETVVWLEFVTSARTDPRLEAQAQHTYSAMRMVIGKMLNRVRALGRLREPVEIAVETERLCALLDGLALNAALQPNHMDGARMRTIINAHLDTIMTR